MASSESGLATPRRASTHIHAGLSIYSTAIERESAVGELLLYSEERSTTVDAVSPSLPSMKKGIVSVRTCLAGRIGRALRSPSPTLPAKATISQSRSVHDLSTVKSNVTAAVLPAGTSTVFSSSMTTEPVAESASFILTTVCRSASP